MPMVLNLPCMQYVGMESLGLIACGMKFNLPVLVVIDSHRNRVITKIACYRHLWLLELPEVTKGLCVSPLTMDMLWIIWHLNA